MDKENAQKQKSEWKRKGWSIPEFRGKKQDWFSIVMELVEILNSNSVADLNSSPNLSSSDTTYPWRVYASFLKGIGLVSNKSGLLCLTEVGKAFVEQKSRRYLANLFHDKYRLFGEVLVLIETTPKTIEEVDKELCRDYCLDWANLSNTRRRMDWLEVLVLIECVGNRKWGLTKEGVSAVNEWLIISADVVDMALTENEVNIMPPPMEIAELLAELAENPALHKKRNTYCQIGGDNKGQAA